MVLIVPDVLDTVGVVGCVLHPTTDSPTTDAMTSDARVLVPGRV